MIKTKSVKLKPDNKYDNFAKEVKGGKIVVYIFGTAIGGELLAKKIKK